MPLPLRIPARSSSNTTNTSEEAGREQSRKIKSPLQQFVPLAVACGFVRDLEALAAVRHPNIRTLLGITLGVAPASEAEDGEEEGVVYTVPTLVYETSRGGCLLFEW